MYADQVLALLALRVQVRQWPSLMMDVAAGSSWRPGQASLVWQQAALRSFDADLRKYGPGAAIVFRRGPYLTALQDVASKLHAGAILLSRRYNRRSTCLSMWRGICASLPAPWLRWGR